MDANKNKEKIQVCSKNKNSSKGHMPFLLFFGVKFKGSKTLFKDDT